LKQSGKDIEKLLLLINKVAEMEQLSRNYRDDLLKGNLRDGFESKF
jgi:hypothetical protein